MALKCRNFAIHVLPLVLANAGQRTSLFSSGHLVAILMEPPRMEATSMHTSSRRAKLQHLRRVDLMYLLMAHLRTAMSLSPSPLNPVHRLRLRQLVGQHRRWMRQRPTVILSIGISFQSGRSTWRPQLGLMCRLTPRQLIVTCMCNTRWRPGSHPLQPAWRRSMYHLMAQRQTRSDLTRSR